MANSIHQPTHNLHTLSNEIYEISKRWFVRSTLLRLAVFVIGVLTIVSQNLSQVAPFILAFLSICAEWCLWQSNDNYGLAETLRRKTDMEDALGWKISRTEMSDVLARVPVKIRQRVKSKTEEEPYFASKKEPGAIRALENLQESAWWSKHLAEKTAHIYMWIMIALIIISLSVLIISIYTINNFSVLSNIGRAVTSTLMLIFSLSLLRSTRGYFKFSQRSQRIEDQACQLLQQSEVEEVQAAKIMNEYHLARAMAPSLPTWVWKHYRDHLNELWQEYRVED